VKLVFIARTPLPEVPPRMIWPLAKVPATPTVPPLIVVVPPPVVLFPVIKSAPVPDFVKVLPLILEKVVCALFIVISELASVKAPKVRLPVPAEPKVDGVVVPPAVMEFVKTRSVAPSLRMVVAPATAMVPLPKALLFPIANVPLVTLIEAVSELLLPITSITPLPLVPDPNWRVMGFALESEPMSRSVPPLAWRIVCVDAAAPPKTSGALMMFVPEALRLEIAEWAVSVPVPSVVSVRTALLLLLKV